MRTVLAANFKAHAGLQEEKIVPALGKLVDLVEVIEARDSTNFERALDKTKPEVVLLMNEVCSHQTSWRLAEVCRPRGIRLAVLGRQKSTWPDVIERLRAGGSRDSFGEHLKRERMARRISHFEVGERCGVDKQVVQQWELDRATPSRYEVQRLVELFPAIQRFLPAGTGFYAEVVHLQNGPPEAAPAPEAPKTFAEALAVLRLAEGMKQEELGEILGVSGQAVSAWETGTNVPVRAHYDALLDLLPDLALAPEPPVQNIDKPNGGEGVERVVVLAANDPQPKEPAMSSRMPNPVLAANYQPPPPSTKPGDVRAQLEGEVQTLRTRVAELEAELDVSRAESVSGAAEAMRRLVRAGFLSEAEAAAKWTARIR
jgi:transcriptional regulator with XRE-family HTH domain